MGTKKMWTFIGSCCVFSLLFVVGCTAPTETAETDESHPEEITPVTEQSIPETEAVEVVDGSMIFPELNVPFNYPEGYKVTWSEGAWDMNEYMFDPPKTSEKSAEPLVLYAREFTWNTVAKYQSSCGDQENIGCPYADSFNNDYQKARYLAWLKFEPYDGYESIKINGEPFLVRDESCEGDSCIVRRYVYYVPGYYNLPIEFWVNRWNASADDMDTFFSAFRVTAPELIMD